MIKSKRGYWYRTFLAIIGSIMLLIGLYYLNQAKIVETAIFGIIGVLLITVSVFPFIEKSEQK